MSAERQWTIQIEQGGLGQILGTYQAATYDEAVRLWALAEGRFVPRDLGLRDVNHDGTVWEDTDWSGQTFSVYLAEQAS